MKAKLLVKQTGSVIGQTEYQRKVIKGLGLRGPGSHVLVANTPSFRGMVKKVLHLVSVLEVDDGASDRDERALRPKPQATDATPKA